MRSSSSASIPSSSSKKTQKKNKLKKKNTTNEYIRTLDQFYRQYKPLKNNEKFGGVERWRVLIDDQSISNYTLGIYPGKRVIEAKASSWCYDAKKQELYFRTSIYQLTFKLVVHVEDQSLYEELQKRVFSNRSDGIFIILGDWKKVTEDSYKCVLRLEGKLK